MLRFLNDINSPNVEVILDPVNLLDRNNYTEQEAVIDKVFKYYGDRVSVMHIKDFKLDENGDVAFEQVGEGLFNYAPLFKHLKEEKPYITMLIENSRENRYHSDCEYLQKIYDEA
jgi:sugar phosphate isomerase/epimerase